MSTTDSPKNRPDGATPEPETDGLNEYLLELHDSFLDVNRAIGRAECARLKLLSVAYAMAEARTEIDTAAGTHSISREDVFHANLRSMIANLSASSNESDIGLTNRAYQAHRLTTEFAIWMPEMESGEVSLRHANGMLRHANKVPEDHRDEFSEQVLEYARRHTPGQTESFAKRLAARLATEQYAAAFEVEYAERDVMLEHGDFGMSRLTASVPTGVAVQFFDLLTEQAKLLRDEHLLDIKEHKQRVRAAHARGEELSEEDANFIEDPRTVAQLRADIFLDTVLTATPQSILESHTAGAERVRANISIVVPVLSLLNPDAPRDVATINGMQPMSLAEARKYVGEATTFDRILTDPITGHVLTVDSRNAPPQMRKFLRMRDQTCRFPGCNRVAHRCDLDHTKPYASGGCTSVNNHAHLCRRHHVQKHQKPWRVRHLGNGVLEWTSPLGVVYITSPEPIGPRFTPVEDPAPF